MKSYEYKRNYELEKDYWWFVGVRQMIKMLFKEKGNKGHSLGKWLDIGCGTGALLDELSPRATEAWGLDISTEALDFCRQRGHKNLVEASADGLPFDDATFDTVTAIGVIEHLEDHDKFVEEINRVLKPGGQAVLLTSSFNFLWSQHDVANEHKRRYYLTEFRDLVQAHGLKAQGVSHMNFVLFLPIASFLLLHRLFIGLRSPEPQRILPETSKPVNWILTKILFFESWLMEKIRLPWGISMLGYFRKDAT